MSYFEHPRIPPENRPGDPSPLGSPWPPPTTPAIDFQPRTARRRRHRGRIAVAAAAVAVPAGAGLIVANNGSGPVATAPTTIPSTVAPTLPSIAAQAQSSETLTSSAIFSKVDPAIVDVNTTVDGGAAAGTGMVLTSSGLVLTNN